MLDYARRWDPRPIHLDRDAARASGFPDVIASGSFTTAIYTLTQVPGGDAAALRLVVIAIVISLVALILSEWLARRAARRLHGV